MTKAKGIQKEVLKYRLETRVSEKKYQELKSILDKNQNKQMSGLLRDILHNRQIRVYTRDLTLDNLMEELARLRTEIKSIGININQITKRFNTYPEQYRKEFYAKVAFKEYLKIDSKVDQLLIIISNLAKKWLQE